MTIDPPSATRLATRVAVLGSAWKTTSAIGELRERTARMEGRSGGQEK